MSEYKRIQGRGKRETAKETVRAEINEENKGENN